jgi:Nif-specific regulatory protein
MLRRDALSSQHLSLTDALISWLKMLAYLVVREGNQWRDLYPLTPGQVITVGRASGNRIVLHDEVCSRHHCELRQVGDDWLIRDLASRNGTLVDGKPIEGEVRLLPGQVIQIGLCELAFTYTIEQGLPHLSHKLESDTDTGAAAIVDALLRETAPQSEPTIIDRRGQHVYGSDRAVEALADRERLSRGLARLYRLALQMGTAESEKRLCEVVLEGLESGTSADIGAVLLLPEPTRDQPDLSNLNVVAYRSSGGEFRYQRVSDSLSRIVLTDREAVLAREVADDSRLVNRDSLGEIQAQSVICAPIRSGTVNYGLVHLYATRPERRLEADDLEFTLAVADQCAVALENLHRRDSLANGLARVRDENLQLREQLGIDSDLIGESPVMQSLRARISRIAPTDSTVLIRGESGVGKELVARSLHFNSHRKSGPFVCMNCAALTESLLESELFGHEKGSFTGAVGRKPGKFEQAHQGTLFLDEVGEMSLGIQAKFLRVLEGHPFERVGGGASVQVNVRVVAATNRNIEKAVEEGKFRKDLYFRLHVVELVVSPLRDRRGDVAALAMHFLDMFARKTGRAVRGFTPLALEKLTSYDWPGNVRELQHAVERAVILCPGDVVGAQDIQLSSLGGSSELRRNDADSASPTGPLATLEEIEQLHIMLVLERTNWNKSQAATILGIERSTLDRKLKRYQVGRPQ